MRRRCSALCSSRTCRNTRELAPQRAPDRGRVGSSTAQSTAPGARAGAERQLRVLRACCRVLGNTQRKESGVPATSAGSCYRRPFFPRPRAAPLRFASLCTPGAAASGRYGPCPCAPWPWRLWPGGRRPSFVRRSSLPPCAASRRRSCVAAVAPPAQAPAPFRPVLPSVQGWVRPPGRFVVRSAYTRCGELRFAPAAFGAAVAAVLRSSCIAASAPAHYRAPDAVRQQHAAFPSSAGPFSSWKRGHQDRGWPDAVRPATSSIARTMSSTLPLGADPGGVADALA